jgi:predicted GIY-YIG superfamily endonuclease
LSVELQNTNQSAPQDSRAPTTPPNLCTSNLSAIFGNAIAREKQWKTWRREKKIALIEHLNPLWRDLSEDFNH